jgi:hypothetical protein
VSEGAFAGVHDSFFGQFDGLLGIPAGDSHLSGENDIGQRSEAPHVAGNGIISFEYFRSSILGCSADSIGRPARSHKGA